MNVIIVNSNNRDRLSALWKSQRAAPYPDVARWLQYSCADYWETRPFTSAGWLQALQPSEGLGENFLYL